MRPREKESTKVRITQNKGKKRENSYQKLKRSPEERDISTVTDAGEEVDEVAGGASGMGANRIGEIGDRASEGQAAGVYGAGFTAGPLAREGARGGLRGMGNKVSSGKELTEIGRMAEGD